MNSRALFRFFKFGHGAVAFVLVAALLLWPVRVDACACCSEEGTWAEWTEPFDASELEELGRLRFAEVANTYANGSGEGGDDMVSSFSGEFSISLLKRQGRRWDLRFRDKQGRTGTLTLTVPTTLTEFQVDPQDGQKSAGGGPLLYKEWRLTGAVSATGIFRRGLSPQTRYRLILQGHGNACTSADMFESWMLQIFGPRAGYSFYGKFKKPA